jgi:hypothetical protein
VKKPLRRALVGLGIIGISALPIFPHTNLWAIRWKIHIIGPRLTYGPLATDDAAWEVVLNGVRSGDSAWLSVASDLKPALDSHPSEEMDGAVSTVLDKNPSGALRILVPSYGAKIVCGEDEEGSVIDRLHAERRALLLKALPASPERQACLSVVGRVLESAGREKDHRQPYYRVRLYATASTRLLSRIVGASL